MKKPALLIQRGLFFVPRKIAWPIKNAMTFIRSHCVFICYPAKYITPNTKAKRLLPLETVAKAYTGIVTGSADPGPPGAHAGFADGLELQSQRAITLI
ncbi:hypothetical protein [Collimonas arenae]|uniref:hypothetical protein n=1 Tax=Collimonas arenae TaxID=279058 RepID=UPI0026A58D60